MPVLKNPRHELFARLRSEGNSTTDAYIGAGYSAKGAGQAGHKLLKKAEIEARILELQTAVIDRVIEKTALTEAYVIDKLMNVADVCSDVDSEHWNPSQANRSAELLGKTLAMFVDRTQEEKCYGDLKNIEEMSAAIEEMAAEAKALMAKRAELLARKDRRDGGGTMH